jgi:hypothetical protein
MTISSYQPTSIVTALVAPSPAIAPARGETPERSGRADHGDARWFVRVVLTADAAAVVRSVRVIIDDRGVQQIVLHTVWADWRDVPMLMAHIPSPLSAQEPPDTIARDLAAALLVALQRDAAACLLELGTPIGSLPAPPPGPQERAARRNARDAALPLGPPRWSAGAQA